MELGFEKAAEAQAAHNEALYDTEAYMSILLDAAEYIECGGFDTLSQEEQLEYSADLAERAMEKCSILDEEVFISGMAILPNDFMSLRTYQEEKIPITVTNYDEDEEAFEAYVDGMFGVYAGISLRMMHDEDGEGWYRLVHRIHFGQNQVYDQEGLVVQNNSYYAMFDADSVLLPVGELEVAALGVLQPEFGSSTNYAELKFASRSLVRMLSSTGFRRKNHLKQISSYEALMSSTQGLSAALIGSILRIELTDNKDSLDKKSEPTWFNPISQDDGTVLYESFNPLEIIKGNTVTGLCLGLACVDEYSVLNGPIRRDSDLISKKSGLCLAIDLSSDPQAENGQQLIYVPIGDGKDIADIHHY